MYAASHAHSRVIGNVSARIAELSASAAAILAAMFRASSVSVLVAVLGIGCSNTIANPPAWSAAAEVTVPPRAMAEGASVQPLPGAASGSERTLTQGAETVADIAEHARRAVFVVRTP